MLGQPFQDRFTDRKVIKNGPQKVEINLQSRKSIAMNRKHTNIQIIGTSNIPDPTKRRLRIMNAAMATFHLIFFITTLAIGDIQLNVDLFNIKLNANTNLSTIPDFRTNNETIPEGFSLNFLQPETERNDEVSLPITWLTSLFFLLSCIFHFGNTVLWYNAYNYYLSIQRSPFRWIEYTFSAPTMILTVAYSAGIVVATELFMIFILIACTMFFGHMTELISTKDKDDKWTLPFSQRIIPHVLGYVPQISAWFVIISTFIQNSEGAPDFVTAIIIIEIILFFSFGFVQLAVLARPPSKYIQGEIAYQILSLISKGLLGIILFTNVIFLSNWQCIVEEVKNKLPEDYC